MEIILSKVDNAFILLCSALVILMSIPGLALFYGGMVRSKNMLSVLVQVFTIFSLAFVLWAIYGYTFAFGEGGNQFIGGANKLLLTGISADSLIKTFSENVYINEITYVIFQGAFAGITCALIVGSFAERIKFSALLVFILIWFSFSYVPMAHMVWAWAGPTAYATAESAAAAEKVSGFLFNHGALDFAGGTVVHINAAIAGLIGAKIIGNRIGLGNVAMAPHNLTVTMIGGSLLWFGWFGFNAGSALEANGTAALAMLNTIIAAAMGTLGWLFAEWYYKGKPSLLGVISGAVAGLVMITPSAGFVGVGGALILGLIGGVACLWGVNGLKKWLKIDDTLDVFGIHGLGGILGAILAAFFANPLLGGTGLYDYSTKQIAEYDTLHQLWVQTEGVIVAIIWSGVVSWIAFKLVDKFIGLRVSSDEEREGLDLSTHGESAYRH